MLEVRILDSSCVRTGAGTCKSRCSARCPRTFPSCAASMCRSIGRAIWCGCRGARSCALEPFLRQFRRGSAAALGPLSSKEPRAFGGNMDNKELGVGSVVYFPVFVDGALFCAGDGHALQGDGEVCLTAIETALDRHVRVHRPHRHEARAAARGNARCLDHDGLRRGSRRRREAGAPRHDQADQASSAGLSPQDAYTLCSIAADLRVTQTVDGNKGIHCVLAKAKLPPRR